MRHYSYKASEIIASKSLKAGPRPYIHPQAHEIRWYEDLTGVLMTTITCHPSKLLMGLTADVGFVDFRLPADMTILKLDECNYLISGKFQTSPMDCRRLREAKGDRRKKSAPGGSIQAPGRRRRRSDAPRGSDPDQISSAGRKSGRSALVLDGCTLRRSGITLDCLKKHRHFPAQGRPSSAISVDLATQPG